jgi:hypothetical protein
MIILPVISFPKMEQKVFPFPVPEICKQLVVDRILKRDAVALVAMLQTNKTNSVA